MDRALQHYLPAQQFGIQNPLEPMNMNTKPATSLRIMPLEKWGALQTFPCYRCAKRRVLTKKVTDCSTESLKGGHVTQKVKAKQAVYGALRRQIMASNR